MSTVIKSIDVDASPSAVFGEWTRFEALPRFMSGVVAVTQLDERRLHWRALVFGVERVWELQITEVVPERTLAWTSSAGPRNHGAIMLEPAEPSGTRVTMEIHYAPTGFVEEVTDYLGVLGRWAERSLARFKDLMEQPYDRAGRLPPLDELVGQ